MNEIKGNFNDVLVVSELRGGFPNVQIASDVDYAGLIAGDDNPVFLTLPIGKAGVTSENKRHYDAVWLQELERQTLSNRPVGLMGHLSKEERAHAFPAEAIHWVGTLLEGDMLWGKGYVPPGEARKRIQRYKAQGKKIATSIDAYGEGVWDERLGAYRMDAKSMRLGQIDIAPADRAGVPDLAAVPLLTTEMQEETSSTVKEPIMAEKDKLTVINEMTADDARLLPEPVRQAIVASVPTPPEVALVQELRTVLDLPAGADIKAHLATLRAEQETARKQAVAGRIKELVEKGINLVAMRGVVTELVNARNPQTVAEAETAYNAVIALDTIKPLFNGAVQEIMGPAQTTTVANGQPGKPKYYTIPGEKE